MRVEVAADLLVDVLDQPALVARRQRVGAHEPLGQADDAELEAARVAEVGRGAERDLDAAAADVDDDGRAAAHVHAVDGGQMDEPRLFGARDDADLDAGPARDLGNEIAAVVGLADGRGRGRHDFVHFVGVGQPAELGQRLEGRRHGRRGQAPAVQAAGPQTDHFLFPVNDFEGQVGPHPHHDHVDRIGADVDGGDAHAGRKRGGRAGRGLACYINVIYCPFGRTEPHPTMNRPSPLVRLLERRTRALRRQLTAADRRQGRRRPPGARRVAPPAGGRCRC